ncbi:hypothetical protein V8G54_006675 [Vigna mungo]|uniref:RING-type domain-containing protein n=1 Tax=Vigna mungo TaxID=3915 RepID=A0AAQ3S7K8_VIGMU
MALKCLLLIYYKNGRGHNFRRQGQMLTLIEYTLLLYRALLPTPVWYRFFLNKDYGSLFSSLTTGLYLTFKLTSVVEKVQCFVSALKALSKKEVHYGVYATTEQNKTLRERKDRRGNKGEERLKNIEESWNPEFFRGRNRDRQSYCMRNRNYLKTVVQLLEILLVVRGSVLTTGHELKMCGRLWKTERKAIGLPDREIGLVGCISPMNRRQQPCWMCQMRQSVQYSHFKTVSAAGDMCAICQEKMQAPILLSCKHMFCEECVSEWFERERTCPLCRALVKPADLRTFGDGSTTKNLPGKCHLLWFGTIFH